MITNNNNGRTKNHPPPVKTFYFYWTEGVRSSAKGTTIDEARVNTLASNPHLKNLLPVFESEEVYDWDGNNWKPANPANLYPKPNMGDGDFRPVSEVQYLLQKLRSEATELAHEIDKTLEFGLGYPDPRDGIPRIYAIEQEYNDNLAIVELLAEKGFPIERQEDLINKKKEKMRVMMELVRQRGLLE